MDRAAQYARDHQKYLRENRPDVLEGLRKDPDGLTSYLSSVGRQAAEMFEHQLAQMNSQPEVQALPYHQKVARLQSHQASAEEIVRDQVINQPEPQETPEQAA